MDEELFTIFYSAVDFSKLYSKPKTDTEDESIDSNKTEKPGCLNTSFSVDFQNNNYGFFLSLLSMDGEFDKSQITSGIMSLLNEENKSKRKKSSEKILNEVGNKFNFDMLNVLFNNKECFPQGEEADIKTDKTIFAKALILFLFSYNICKEHTKEVFEEFIRRSQKSIDDEDDNLFIVNRREKEDKRGKKDNNSLISIGDNEVWSTGIVGVIDDDLPLFDIVKLLYGSKLADDVNILGRLEELFGGLYIHIHYEITSRFDFKDKPYFLATMLLRDMRMSAYSVPQSADEIYDFLLLFRFMSLLQKANLKGFFKQYRVFMENDSKVRGTIDFTRHIKENLGMENGKMAYTYRSHSTDNFLNLLIVAAYDCLKLKYPEMVRANFDSNYELKRIIFQLRNETGYKSISNALLITKNEKPISHPYFIEYEALRKVCASILRSESVSMWNAEEASDLQGVLYYCPDLWEFFVEDILYGDSEIEFEKQAIIPVLDDRLTAKPDIVLFDNNKPIAILDAKFKPAWSAIITGKEDVFSSSLLDDFTKCLRDMVAVNAHTTGIIAPVRESDLQGAPHIEHKISDYNSDKFLTIPLVIPSTEISENAKKVKNKKKQEDNDYLKWREELDKNITLFHKHIKKFVLGKENQNEQE